ncbi:MAG: helix-turn-helix transcriptional regulator [Lawsonibacter sp.]|nr:helix-turn-helix transcriptional regulator [Lawsonibacter sp.]
MSENKFRREETMARCVPMGSLQAVLGGKWKILILWYVTFYRVQRFGELLRRLDGITQSTLTKQLRELERDGFLHREVFGEVPPRVEYTLTGLGRSFAPVLYRMLVWSEEHLCPPGYVSPYREELLRWEPGAAEEENR